MIIIIIVVGVIVVVIVVVVTIIIIVIVNTDPVTNDLPAEVRVTIIQNVAMTMNAGIRYCVAIFFHPAKSNTIMVTVSVISYGYYGYTIRSKWCYPIHSYIPGNPCTLIG